MQPPEALLARVRTSWVRHRHAWLAGEGRWPLEFPVGTPTQAEVAANWSGFDAWLRRWREHRGAGQVRYIDRSWSKLGQQQVPRCWSFDAPESVAEALGEAERWIRASRRYGQWMDQFALTESHQAETAAQGDGSPVAKVLSRSFDLLADLDEGDFVRLTDVLAWLLANPDSGLYLRQLPIAGVDTKWIEPYRGVLADWLAALRGIEPTAGFHAIAGLRPVPDRIRVRLLDPILRSAVGGLEDIASPLPAIAALPVQATRVFIVENLATGLAFSDLPGAAVFMARGYAIDVIDQIPWLRGLPIAYWGDIDTHGLAILDRLRSRLPQVQSLLMDEATLLRFRNLWVEEAKPARVPYLPNLTPVEAKLYAGLRCGAYGTRVRLEQERIPWDWAWNNVRGWLATL